MNTSWKPKDQQLYGKRDPFFGKKERGKNEYKSPGFLFSFFKLHANVRSSVTSALEKGCLSQIPRESLISSYWVLGLRFY